MKKVTVVQNTNLRLQNVKGPHDVNQICVREIHSRSKRQKETPICESNSNASGLSHAAVIKTHHSNADSRTTAGTSTTGAAHRLQPSINSQNVGVPYPPLG